MYLLDLLFQNNVSAILIGEKTLLIFIFDTFFSSEIAFLKFFFLEIYWDACSSLHLRLLCKSKKSSKPKRDSSEQGISSQTQELYFIRK